MVKTLRESKVKLSELVELASQGQDVLISVRGKVKVRLTRATAPCHASPGSAWAQEFQALQRACGAPETKSRVEDILAQDREDRL
jgi:prevent-host-death family protein